MPDEFSVVKSQPGSGKKKTFFLIFLLLISFVFNVFFGYQAYQNYKKQSLVQATLPKGNQPATKSPTTELTAYPIPFINKSVQDVKVTYKFNVTLNNIATESGKLKLVTHTLGGTNFNYFLDSQTKVSSKEQPVNTSSLKVGQNLAVIAEYYPRQRSWKVLSVDIL